MQSEVNVKLKAHEIGVLLSALNLLETGDEHRICKNYGSCSAIEQRLQEAYATVDKTNMVMKYESYCEPSF